MENNLVQNLSEVGIQVNVLVYPDQFDKLRYITYKRKTNVAEIVRDLIDQLPDERPEPNEQKF
jgi:hypothetical protein